MEKDGREEEKQIWTAVGIRLQNWSFARGLEAGKSGGLSRLLVSDANKTKSLDLCWNFERAAPAGMSLTHVMGALWLTSSPWWLIKIHHDCYFRLASAWNPAQAPGPVVIWVLLFSIFSLLSLDPLLPFFFLEIFASLTLRQSTPGQTVKQIYMTTTLPGPVQCSGDKRNHRRSSTMIKKIKIVINPWLSTMTRKARPWKSEPAKLAGKCKFKFEIERRGADRIHGAGREGKGGDGGEDRVGKETKVRRKWRDQKWRKSRWEGKKGKDKKKRRLWWDGGARGKGGRLGVGGGGNLFSTDLTLLSASPIT